jgi:nicotinate-nucleotide adenylyltransferase
MVEAAIADNPGFRVSTIEVEREGPSYTVDTLRELQRRHPGAELYFLTGADNLRELHLWREPDAVARLARLVVLARGGEGVPEDARFPAQAVAVTRVDLSSSEVRRRVKAGESIRYLVPDAVRALVERHGLYRG